MMEYRFLPNGGRLLFDCLKRDDRHRMNNTNETLTMMAAVDMTF